MFRTKYFVILIAVLGLTAILIMSIGSFSGTNARQEGASVIGNVLTPDAVTRTYKLVPSTRTTDDGVRTAFIEKVRTEISAIPEPVLATELPADTVGGDSLLTE